MMSTPTITESVVAASPVRALSGAHGEGSARGVTGLGGVDVREVIGGLRITCRPNVALTPSQLCAAFMAAMGFSITVAVGWFVIAGVPWVLPFSLVELGGFAFALWYVARHATDLETILVFNDTVTVESCCGGAASRATFDRAQVEPRLSRHADGTIEMNGRGQSVQLGRQLNWRERRRLSNALSAALNHRLATPMTGTRV